jgi:hypothetical protein
MAKKQRKYKDSGMITFSYRTTYQITRRMLKSKFDEMKAALLSELAAEPDVLSNRIAHVRKLDFDKFQTHLQNAFQMAVDDDNLDPDHYSFILVWAEEEFEEWAQ